MLISAVIIWFVSTLNFKWMSQHSAIAHGFLIKKSKNGWFTWKKFCLLILPVTYHKSNVV